MPHRCLVPGCSTIEGQGTPLFCFPTDVQEKLEWINSLNLQENDVIRSSRVCMLHFAERDLNVSGNRLKKGAVPRIEVYASDESVGHVRYAFFSFFLLLLKNPIFSGGRLSVPFFVARKFISSGWGKRRSYCFFYSRLHRSGKWSVASKLGH